MNIIEYIFAFILILHYFASIYLKYADKDKENAFYLACMSVVVVFAFRLKPIIEYLKNFKFNKK